MPAAEVEPAHPGQQVPELLFHGCQRHGQRVGVLLAQGVEVQSVQQPGQGRVCLHGGVPLGTCGTQAAARGAGVVNGVALLGGALGVHPQPHALACGLCCGAELCQLPGRVEHDVVRILQKLCKFIVPVGGAEYMVLFFRQFLFAKAALVQAAGLGARQIGGQQRVHVKVGKRLLCQ